MPTELYNHVGMTTATAGTGTITLGSALTAVQSPYSVSYQSFASAGVTSSDIVSYLIHDINGNWELGYGTYSSAAGTLTRNLDQSATGALLNLSGTAQVFIAARAINYQPDLPYHAGLGGL